MPAFNDKQTASVQSVISKLYSRAVAHKACTLTHEDMKHLLVRPEHFKAVDEARELFGNSSGETVDIKAPDPHSKGGELVIGVELAVTRDEPGFPFPTYVGQQLFGDADSEARKKLDAWIKWRTRVGREWCLANAVFQELNRRCNTPAQMRYFWSSIVGILTLCDDEKVRAKADKLRAYKAPSGIPRVEKELAEACRGASAIISKGLLYPEPEGTPVAERGSVKLSMSSFATAPRPWDPTRVCTLIHPA
jgi:hypothetical protein